MRLLGIILLVVGALALLYQGVSFFVPKEVVDVGFFKLTVSEKKTIPLPPIVGIVSLALGGLFFFMAGRKTA